MTEFKEGQTVIINKRSHRNIWCKETKAFKRNGIIKLEGVFVKYECDKAVVRVKTPLGYKNIKFNPAQLEVKQCLLP